MTDIAILEQVAEAFEALRKVCDEAAMPGSPGTRSPRQLAEAVRTRTEAVRVAFGLAADHLERLDACRREYGCSHEARAILEAVEEWAARTEGSDPYTMEGHFASEFREVGRAARGSHPWLDQLESWTEQVRSASTEAAPEAPPRPAPQPAAETSPKPAPAPASGEADPVDSKNGHREIEALACRTPPLNTESGDWIKPPEAARIEGCETGTLRRYRSAGIKSGDGTLGRDRDGRVWRKLGAPNSRCWYLKSSLKSRRA